MDVAMNSTVEMKLARRFTLPVIVRSSPIVEILSGSEFCARADVSILSHPKEPLDIRIICLPMKAIIPSKLVVSPRILRSHAQQTPQIGDNSAFLAANDPKRTFGLDRYKIGDRRCERATDLCN